MRMALFSLLAASVFMNFSGPNASAGTGTGNGGDPVEVRFAAALDQTKDIFGRLQNEMVPMLRINSDFQVWLLEKTSGNRTRLSQYRFLLRYFSRDKLVFQDGACLDTNNAERPITYMSDDQQPWICISRSLNAQTSQAEAMALLIHEVGHGTGETEHIFLSDFGRAIADPQATAGIQLSPDRRKVFVDLTIDQLEPNKQPFVPNQHYNNGDMKDAACICRIYGFDDVFSSVQSVIWNQVSGVEPICDNKKERYEISPVSEYRYVQFFRAITCSKNIDPSNL